MSVSKKTWAAGLTLAALAAGVGVALAFLGRKSSTPATADWAPSGPPPCRCPPGFTPTIGPTGNCECHEVSIEVIPMVGGRA